MTDIFFAYIIPSLIILTLIFLNAVFVVGEFAVISLSRHALEVKAGESKIIDRLIRIVNTPRFFDQYITTCQLGITAASLGLGMYAEHMIADWILITLQSVFYAHIIASILAVIIVTYLHITLGEMIPKSLALINSEKAAADISPFITFFHVILYPLIILLGGINNGILAIFGIKRQTQHSHTSAEIEYLLEESEEQGLLEPESADVLQDILDFENLDAGDVMVPRVHVQGIPLHADKEKIKEIVENGAFGRYPVYRDDIDHIIGVVTVKDLLYIVENDTTLNSRNIRQVPFVAESTAADTVLETMREKRIHIAVVMDEHGGTAGIVTLDDLFGEIIGEISEDVSEKPAIIEENENKIIVGGTVRLDEVGEIFDIELTDEDVDTVSGLIIKLLDRPPHVGDMVTFNDLTFTVLQTKNHGVVSAKIDFSSV